MSGILRNGANQRNFMDGYEKIKTVGKGSFGTANLYKRNKDGKFVVMKHIHISDASPHERTMALNEIHVLSSLDNENIIRYLGSFETDAAIVIVMEYANGGNLAQLINIKRNNDDPLAENSILNIFSQICKGIGYMHSHKILHRDLKSANIFLTRDGIVKIGDFGISKMLTSKSSAHTVVGTPYYLSPEICEGKGYTEKSDVWSLGCILYEMICLRKPFEAKSLPSLLQKITEIDYKPIPETYSDGTQRLIRMILQRDQSNRPAAQYIYQTIIPAIYETLLDADASNQLSLSSVFNRSIPNERSMLYELYGFTKDPNIYPVKLPHAKIVDCSNSGTHFIVLTADNKLYSWGEDIYGQLGQGQPSEYKSNPTYVEFFRGTNIVRCIAGESFSLFLTETGRMFACGDGSSGSLGLGDWNSATKPTKINHLDNDIVVTLSCTTTHILALTSNGKVLAWGCGQDGQLGLDNTKNMCKPMRVPIDNALNVKDVFAGYDNSAILTTTGQVLVAGDNTNNKLGLGAINFSTRFVSLAGIKDRIQDVTLALKHSVFLTNDGEVLCMGSNQSHQCGVGAYVNGVLRVQNLPKIHMITAGTSYTVAASEDNVIYFWGTHYLKSDASSNQTYNFNLEKQSSAYRKLNKASTASGSRKIAFSQMEKLYKCLKYEIQEESVQRSLGTFRPVVQKEPSAIFALYASQRHIEERKVLWLAGISANDNSLSILVHTTVPPPIKKVEDVSSGSILMNWNRSNRIYKNQILPNTPQSD